MGIRLKNIKKRFPDFNIEIDLTINKGELVTLLGPSGCGKTTTLSLISGILTPDSGNIFIGSTRVTDVPIWDRDIGIVFQDYALFPHMNVLANISYGLKARRKDSETIKGICQKMLDLVHLGGYEKREVESLSGGEKQRTALARALAPSPRLLLLDEPLSALDATLRRSLRREIREIQQKLGITTIYVTHDQEEALSISDRIVLMNKGKIEQTGTPWELYNRPATKFCGDFLGDSNTIPCTVEKADRTEGILLSTENTELLFRLPWREKILPKQNYLLFFRPQDTKINFINKFSQQPPPKEVVYKAEPSTIKPVKGGDFSSGKQENSIVGKIVSTEYFGRQLSVEYRWGKTLLKTEIREMDYYYTSTLTEGENITVTVNPEKCWLIKT